MLLQWNFDITEGQGKSWQNMVAITWFFSIYFKRSQVLIFLLLVHRVFFAKQASKQAYMFIDV